MRKVSNDDIFESRIIDLYKKSDLGHSEKNSAALIVAACCDTKEHEGKIINYLKSEGITLTDARDYALSIVPRVVIED